MNRTAPLAFLLLAACSSQIVGPSPSEPSEPEPPLPAPTAAPVLAVAVGADVLLVRDGQAETVWSFAPSETPWITLSAKGGFLAAIATTTDAAGAYTSDVVLLDAGGAVLFEAADLPGWSGGLHVSEEGGLAVGLGDGATLVRAPGAAGSELVEGVTPAGPPLASGAVPVWLSPGVGPAFWTAEGGVAALPDGGSGAMYGAGAFHWTTDAGGATKVWRGTPDAVASVTLEGDGWGWVKSISPAGDAVVALNAPDGTSAVDWLLSGEDLAATPIPAPEGQTPFGYAYYFGASFLDSGALWLPARDATTGAAFVHDGTGWTTVGGTFRDIWDLSLVERDGTVVILASDEPGYFPMDPWAPGAADHGGKVTLAIGLGVERELPVEAMGPAVSVGGTHVAFSAGGGEVQVLDVASGDLATVVATKDGAWPPFVWVD